MINKGVIILIHALVKENVMRLFQKLVYKDFPKFENSNTLSKICSKNTNPTLTTIIAMIRRVIFFLNFLL